MEVICGPGVGQETVIVEDISPGSPLKHAACTAATVPEKLAQNICSRPRPFAVDFCDAGRTQEDLPRYTYTSVGDGFVQPPPVSSHLHGNVVSGRGGVDYDNIAQYRPFHAGVPWQSFFLGGNTVSSFTTLGVRCSTVPSSRPAVAAHSLQSPYVSNHARPLPVPTPPPENDDLPVNYFQGNGFLLSVPSVPNLSQTDKTHELTSPSNTACVDIESFLQEDDECRLTPSPDEPNPSPCAGDDFVGPHSFRSPRTPVTYPTPKPELLSDVLRREGGSLPVPVAIIRRRRRSSGNSSLSSHDDPDDIIAKRREANARERQRVRNLNTGFAKLRRMVPSLPPNRKPSKVDTLHAAIDYIRTLQYVLSEANKSPVPLSHTMCFPGLDIQGENVTLVYGTAGEQVNMPLDPAPLQVQAVAVPGMEHFLLQHNNRTEGGSTRQGDHAYLGQFGLSQGGQSTISTPTFYNGLDIGHTAEVQPA